MLFYHMKCFSKVEYQFSPNSPSRRSHHRCDETDIELSVIKSYHRYSDGQFSRQSHVPKLMFKLQNFVAATLNSHASLKNIGYQTKCMCGRRLYFDRFTMEWCLVLHIYKHKPLSKAVSQWDSQSESNVYTFVIKIDCVTYWVNSVRYVSLQNHKPSPLPPRIIRNIAMEKENNVKKLISCTFSLPLSQQIFLSLSIIKRIFAPAFKQFEHPEKFDELTILLFY